MGDWSSFLYWSGDAYDGLYFPKVDIDMFDLQVDPLIF
jgi:hypothetical protein